MFLTRTDRRGDKKGRGWREGREGRDGRREREREGGRQEMVGKDGRREEREGELVGKMWRVRGKGRSKKE